MVEENLEEKERLLNDTNQKYVVIYWNILIIKEKNINVIY